MGSSRPAERRSLSSRMNFPWRLFIHQKDELLPLIPCSQARGSKSRMNVYFILFILTADEVWPRLFQLSAGVHVREKPASEGNLQTRVPKSGIHRRSFYSYPTASADLTLFMHFYARRPHQILDLLGYRRSS